MVNVEDILGDRDPAALSANQWASLLRDHSGHLAVAISVSWVDIYVFHPRDADRRDLLTARYDYTEKDRVEDLKYRTANLAAALDGETPRPVAYENIPDDEQVTHVVQ